MAKQFDVVIIGGGLAGASCALSVAKTNPALNIAVVEANQVTGDYHPSFDDRSIALAQQSVEYLQSLNLFEQNAPYTAAIKKVSVSDRGHFGKAHINCDEFAKPSLGYVVEVNPFGRALHLRLTQSNITLLCPDSVTAIEQTLHSNTLTLQSGEQLNAALLVIADGAQSPTRSLLGLGFNTQPYEQGAIIANVEVAGGHNNHAFERFTQNGPMALLPMSNNRYSLVWCMRQDQVEQHMALNEQDFISALQSAFGYRGGQFTKVGMRTSYPLVYGQVESLIAHRTVVIGNAAHAIHPIAGQGFNLGLRDVQVLSNLIANSQHDLGSYAFTREYSKKRSDDIKTVMSLTDALVRLFSNSSRVLALGRSIGLFSMDLFPALKAPLAKQLMGQVKQGRRL
ncbi:MULTISPECIES: 2-octaprenyl-6-methoxyphenyl hydroxylase [Pseudoalteromonas]|uniref:2-octaprenyl-6-methoxyphenyl hydroxylase n=1 Tax=Pseudoalteromonas fuliginea TaxID=1872678 RepID=A0ABD3YBH5_9GAMM|nr:MULTISPECIES: 2-octaprenyl-6-methoxyphenyl hydroxylase [Pseudoalteromonas]KDC52090.1 2-octaprenyl-6-methoxyphenyl hydroxylase [Pseudoalteromonas fuliginea]KJZ22422.1 2-octaprenyl-6-methoxyphenyl hydroxylase [Pseudoalteromonas fuliginea]GAA69929.1 2-octaprenyl-6-methoxyphenol hydroxylase [Pseudoalteromonas sp. BSi20429]